MKKISMLVLNAMMILATNSIAETINQKVTPENFIRAETDHMYTSMIKNAGGTNKFFHFRTPTPLDKQTVIRMNRDVLYSGGVFDGKVNFISCGRRSTKLHTAINHGRRSITTGDDNTFNPELCSVPGQVCACAKVP